MQAKIKYIQHISVGIAVYTAIPNKYITIFEYLHKCASGSSRLPNLFEIGHSVLRPVHKQMFPKKVQGYQNDTIQRTQNPIIEG